jgi:hypothetical protein
MRTFFMSTDFPGSYHAVKDRAYNCSFKFQNEFERGKQKARK